MTPGNVKPCRACLLCLLLNTFNGNNQFYVLRRRTQIRGDIKIFQMNFPCGFKTCAFATPRIVTAE